MVLKGHMKKKALRSLVIVSCLLLCACSTDEVLSSIDIALQAAGSIEAQLGQLSPAGAAFLTTITNDATTGLNDTEEWYSDYTAACGNAAPTTPSCATAWGKAEASATATEQTLTQDLASLPPDVPAADVTKIKAFVNLAIDAANVVFEIHNAATQSGQAPASVALAAFTKKHGTKKNTTAASLKARWNSEVCGTNKSCRAMVKVHKYKTQKGKKS
jgi:hypothetical protein